MNSEDLIKGFVGTSTSLGATAISCLPAIETGLRICSLGVGLTIGVITLIGFIKRKNK